MFTVKFYLFIMPILLVSCSSTREETFYDEQNLLKDLYSQNFDVQKKAITRLLDVGRHHRPLTQKEVNWLTDLIDKETEYRLKIRAIPALCYAKDKDAATSYLTQFIAKNQGINNETIIVNNYVCRSLSLLGNKESVIVISDWLNKLKTIPDDDSVVIVSHWLERLKDSQEKEGK